MTEPTTPTEDVRDFTVNRKHIVFKLGASVYSVNPRMSPIKLKRFIGLQGQLGALGKLAGAAGDLSAEQLDSMVGALGQVFAVMVGGDQGAKLAEELATSEDIDLMAEAMPAFYYLLEQTGLRPTQQSSLSSSEPATGALTDGAPAETSTGEESLSSINS